MLGCGTDADGRAPAVPEMVLSRAEGSWPQWGGPAGDFQIEVDGLADSWPIEGPPELWKRSLGEGYSGIVTDSGELFTMYRDGDDEVVVSLAADDGAAIWEHRYPARPRSGNVVQFGKGPNATPLLLSDRVLTLGYSGALICLSRDEGKVLWSYDLVEDLEGDVMEFGYAASPILHAGKVIVLVGGKRAGAVAFDPRDGTIAWSGPATSVSYATPTVIEVDGQLQLVYFSADEIIGLDVSNGRRLWSHPVVNQYRNHATGPLWGSGNLLWVATQSDGGTRGLRLSRVGDETRVEEVWSTNKIMIHFWNALRMGDHVFASTGSNASVLAGVDARTGEVVWRRRGFQQANLVHAGDRTILLDAKGHLALVDLGPQGMTVRSEVRVVEGPTWTVPTLSGTKLYLRDKETIRALDLGKLSEERR
jgi:outer membrane protein assembly factor BamB